MTILVLAGVAFIGIRGAATRPPILADANVETPAETPMEKIEEEERIKVKKTEVEEAIPFTTIEEMDENLNEGERVVSLEGIEGKALVSFEEFYLDGVKIAHTETDRKTIVEAINEVVKIGTALVVEETKPVASTNPAPESKPR